MHALIFMDCSFLNLMWMLSNAKQQPLDMLAEAVTCFFCPL